MFLTYAFLLYRILLPASENLQRIIDESMIHRQGAAVAIDVETGQVLAFYRMDVAARRLAAPGSAIKPTRLFTPQKSGPSGSRDGAGLFQQSFLFPRDHRSRAAAEETQSDGPDSNFTRQTAVTLPPLRGLNRKTDYSCTRMARRSLGSVLARVSLKEDCPNTSRKALRMAG